MLDKLCLAFSSSSSGSSWGPAPGSPSAASSATTSSVSPGTLSPTPSSSRSSQSSCSCSSSTVSPTRALSIRTSRVSELHVHTPDEICSCSCSTYLPGGPAQHDLHTLVMNLGSPWCNLYFMFPALGGFASYRGRHAFADRCARLVPSQGSPYIRVRRLHLHYICIS